MQACHKLSMCKNPVSAKCNKGKCNKTRCTYIKKVIFKKMTSWNGRDIPFYLYWTEWYVVCTFLPSSTGNIFSQELKKLNLKTYCFFSHSYLVLMTLMGKWVNSFPQAAKYQHSLTSATSSNSFNVVHFLITCFLIFGVIF